MKTALIFLSGMFVLLFWFSVQYASAEDGYTPPDGFVAGSPPVNVIITDNYRTVDFPESPDVLDFSGRGITTYDIDGNRLSSQKITSAGELKLTKTEDYEETGMPVVNFHILKRNYRIGLSNLLVLTEYDSEGRPICEKYVEFEPGRTEITEQSMFYDYTWMDDTLITVKKASSNEDYWTRIEETYDGKGNLIKKTETTNHTDNMGRSESESEIREYDGSGNLVKATQFNDNGEIVHEDICEYDSSGRIVKSTRIGHSGSKSTSERIYEYDGGITRIIESKDGGEPYESYYVERNEYGDVVLQSINFTAYPSRTWTAYEYEDRDEYGNWRKKTTTEKMVDKDGKETLLRKFVHYRTIIYYPELPDVSEDESSGENGAETAE